MQAGIVVEGDLDFLARVVKKVEQIREDLGSAGPVIADQVEQATGRRPPWAVRAFRDPVDDVRESMRLIRESPYLLSREVRGTVYDVETGKLVEVG